METRKLWDRDGLAVWAGWESNGDLTLSGQDFRGADLSGGEYEYSLTVKPADLPKLTEALGCDRDGLLAALQKHAEKIINQGELKWLRSLGVEPGFFSF